MPSIAELLSFMKRENEPSWQSERNRIDGETTCGAGGERRSRHGVPLPDEVGGMGTNATKGRGAENAMASAERTRSRPCKRNTLLLVVTVTVTV